MSGDRYRITTTVDDRRVSETHMRDPFAHHRVTVGWCDLLRGVFRRKVVVVVVLDADPEMVEDVLELDADYLGKHGSTRRAEWNRHVLEALARGGAR